MAGGQGSRLWPLSQQQMPKQFIDLTGVGKTMLQLTYERFRAICEPDHFVVVTSKEYKDLVAKQLPELPEQNILCEPFRRSTAACVAYANTFVKQKDSNAVLVVTPSDHLILNEQLFVDSVMSGVRFADTCEALVTIGVRAHKPETAFGYIQVGEPVKGFSGLTKVKTFTEKPNKEMAQIFFECGDFCWNSGVFIWKLPSIERAMTKYLPNVQSQFDVLDTIPLSHWTDEAITRVYEECENISVDYGIMEKARNVYVQLTEAQWSDVGSWDAIYEQGDKDANGNSICGGNALLYDSKGCMVRVPDGHYCVVDGLENYMVVEQGNVIIVCPRDKAGSTWRYATDINVDKNM